MNSPRDARRFVFVRDRGTCKKCTRYCGPDDPGTVQDIINDIMSPEHKQGSTVDLGRWELDHVIPLKHANGRPECWQLGNMQTLCHDCHTIKTREDKIKYGDVDTRS
jgi:5-methylcytosine-specific restriction endonuclease McrA